MGRFVGVDYGTRRIGLALSDAGATLATPMATLPGSGDPAPDARAVARWAVEHQAPTVVVGIPLNMDGSDSKQTKLTRAFADALRALPGLTVELWDERLTSFHADMILDEASVRRSRRAALRDALAAQVILQSFLDARQSRRSKPAGDDATSG